MLRIRTSEDNQQLHPGEAQFESVQGAVPANIRQGRVVTRTVRGVPGRKSQRAHLDGEALDAFIAHLQ